MLPDHPLPDDDEAAAAALADAWVALAATDPALLRIALRAVGRLKAPEQTPWDEIAASMGSDRHTIRRIAAKAIQKLRFSPEVRSLNPES